MRTYLSWLKAEGRDTPELRYVLDYAFHNPIFVTPAPHAPCSHHLTCTNPMHNFKLYLQHVNCELAARVR